MSARFFLAWAAGATAWLVLAPGARAKLEFENTTITVPAQWSDTEAVAVYKFKNTGPETVKITDVQPSCGCTTPMLDKDTYAPGESGEVRLDFAFGGRSGSAREMATVMTDLPSQPTIELTIQTTIPRVLDFDPQVVYWKTGDKLDPKTVDITLAPDLPFEKLEIGSAGDNFQTSLKEIAHGQHYTLTVTPLPLAKLPAGNITTASNPIARAAIPVILHLTGDKTRSGIIYAFIFSTSH
ncbi:MAG: DUF1573 domain-containing protein [Opitutales bacterium]